MYMICSIGSRDVAYAPLAEGDFRLLRILGLDVDGRPSTRLDHMAYGAEMKYNCVSYSWNGQFPSKAIECNGTDLLMTLTVYQFLEVLLDTRGVGEDLWIDGICINQKDDEEKAHQIKRLLYRYPSPVLTFP